MAEPFAARIEAENNHVCIKVTDFDTALHFYRDLVGLPIIRRMGTDEDVTFYWLPGIQLARREVGAAEASAGAFDHIGLSVENIAEVCARLDAAGYQAETPLGTRDLPGVERRVMNAFYRDPDGNRVEFVHWV